MAAPIPDVIPQYFFGGAWVECAVLAEDGPVTIERGYTDEGTIRPSKLSMRINDLAAPSLNPSRPTSPLYAITGRALPVAVAADGSIRALLETSVMDPDETQDFSESPARGLRWLDVEAGGPLYRVGQWSDQLQSPMTRTFLQYATLIGFWPGEERGALSTRVGLGVASASGITLGDDDAPAGASGSFVGSPTTSVVLSPLNASTSAGFQVFFSTKLPFVPVSPATTPFFTWRANGLLWSLEIDNIAMHLKLYSGGVLLDDSNTGLGGIPFTDWVTWRAKCYQSGGNVVCELAWSDGNTVLGITRTVAGTIDRLTSIRINGNTLVDGTHYTELGALTTVADNLQSLAVLRSFVGYAGETTVARFQRLCAEAGIAVTVLGTTSTAMGAQKAGRLFDLFKEIAATEDGLIFDQRDDIKIVLRTRRDRMNQTAALTLAYGTHVVPPFRERLDNVGVQNVITIEDRSGATASATRTTGPMSADPYPDGIGVYKGGAYPDVDVNLSDPTLLQGLTDWYLARGTVAGPRFPTVVIEVGLKTPAIRAAAQDLEIGDRILVTGRLPDPIDLHVIGINERIDIHEWTFTLTCIPGDTFDVGAEDSTDHLLDTYANTIITAPAPATTGTSMVVGSPDSDDVWSTTSLPYPVRVSGEKMTVTAATAPALVSGTWRQTLTVTRSVNGVVKAQVVGTPVHVFTPIREAW